MKYLTFSPEEQTSYEVCFLVPYLNKKEMTRHYIEPYFKGEEDKVLAYDLFKDGKQTKVALQREYLDDLLPILMDLGVKYLVTCDAEYFKTLTKETKVDNCIGYVKDCVVGGFKVVYCPNYKQVFYDPAKVLKNIRAALTAINNHRGGSYIDPGMEIIKFGAYPKTISQIKTWLNRLLEMDKDLSMDIEGFSLKHYEAGIGTISFAWSKHEGIAFPVDYHPIHIALKAPFGYAKKNHAVRALLKDFFKKYLRKATWHNISYDVTVLIYQLFMDDLLDVKGLHEGLDVMLRNFDDTKLITYLATNSCAGNELGLKKQSIEFAGNYAQDEIKDIRNIPLDELLQYNLVDAFATNYVKEKHWDTMVEDEQLEIYTELFKPAVIDIVQMQLTGMPLDMKAVKNLHKELSEDSTKWVKEMKKSSIIEAFTYQLCLDQIEKDNKKLKTKKRTMEEVVDKVIFNPNSAPQLQRLIYGEDFMGLPVIDLTDSKLPATGAKTLEKLLNHTTNPDYIAFLEALFEYKKIDKILTDFLPNMLAAPQAPDGWHYLYGNFNLGGTVSGRLSSSGPNLQNLPANGPLAKRVKKCFKAPPGYLFVGLDFASLEDRISALTTKDPNKLKVYTDGYDGHCLRAYSYFSEQMPDIDPSTVDGINSIAEKYKDLRGKSKAPTFALTYQGTFATLMNNCGFTKELAIQIETRFKDLYRVSIEWVDKQLDQASKDGYVTAAFGLRVRTPKLAQTVRGTSRTPAAAEAEGRTAGNALGQSWCLLNTRAGIEFNRKARAGKYRYDIRPCAHIHDAQYFLIPEEMAIIQYLNVHLVKAVQWQDHPAIWHDEVKLGGELSIFFPDWSAEMEIPNGASDSKIESLAEKHLEKLAMAA